MKKTEDPYQMARLFHETFEPHPPKKPRAFSAEEAAFRAGFKIEELVELMYGAVKGDETAFQQAVTAMHENIEQAKEKILAKKESVEDPMVAEVDALVDLLYFTFGSFALMGIDPMPIYKIVHEANMGKLFPDGKPRYHSVTHKVLKPDDWQEKYAPEPLIKQELDRQSRQ